MDTLNVLLGLILFLPDPSFTYYTKSFGDDETYNPVLWEEETTTNNMDSLAELFYSLTVKLNRCMFNKFLLNPMPNSTVGEWHCSNNYTAIECMIEVLDEFSPYLKQGEGENIQKIYNNTQLEFYDFICKGKENWMDSFKNNGGDACVTQNKHGLQKCVTNETSTLISELIHKSRGYSLQVLICRTILFQGKCKWKYMSPCESKKAISLQREFVEFIKNLKACRGQGLISGSAAVRSTLPQYFLSTVLVLLLNKLRNDITLSDIFV